MKNLFNNSNKDSQIQRLLSNRLRKGAPIFVRDVEVRFVPEKFVSASLARMKMMVKTSKRGNYKNRVLWKSLTDTTSICLTLTLLRRKRTNVQNPLNYSIQFNSTLRSSYYKSL